MHPTEAEQSAELEEARLTFVTCKEVHKVEACQQVYVNGLCEGVCTEVASAIVLSTVVEVNVTFSEQTEYRGDVLTNTDTSVGVEVVCPNVLISLSRNTALDTDVPVVGKLATNYCCLCRSSNSHGSSSKE